MLLLRVQHSFYIMPSIEIVFPFLNSPFYFFIYCFYFSIAIFLIYITAIAKNLSLNAFATTKSEEKLIAAAPIIGLSLIPKGTYNAPAAAGIQIML